jgi:hypothetical protein
MGGTGGAVASDASALFLNPALLVSISAGAASFMHARLFETLDHDTLGYVHRVGSNAGIGIGVQYLSAGKIPETDEMGFETGGTMRPRDLAATIGYSQRFPNVLSGFSVGGAVKYIDSRLAGSAATVATDIGMVTDPMGRKNIRLAFVAQNLGGKLKFDDEPAPLPLNFMFGSCWSIGRNWSVAVDLNLPRDNEPSISAGVERVFTSGRDWVFRGMAGVNSRTIGDIPGSGFSAGVGGGFRSVGLDYAFSPYGDLGSVHRLSLSVGF